MKFLKLLLVFGLLCKSIAASKCVDNSEKLSFSVEKLWQSCRKGKCTCTCPCEDLSWQEGVQASVDGCREAASAFRGEGASNLGETVVNSVQEYVTKLIYLANTNSSIVTSSSQAILKTLSIGKNLNGSGEHIIVEFHKAFPVIVKEFNEIATKLSAHIGDLAYSFTNAVGDFGCVFSKFMKEFLESGRLFNCRRNVDFIPVLKKLQDLMNTVALISQTLLIECNGKATQEVYDSVLVLYLLYFYLGLSPPGIHSCVLDVLFYRNCPVSRTVQSCSLTFEYALVENAQALSAVVFPFNKTVKDLLTAFVNITMSLNTAVKDILGLFNGVSITVSDITKNLLKGTKATVYSTKRFTNILKVVTSRT